MSGKPAVLCVHIPFILPVAPGKSLERFVKAYAVVQDGAVLVDAGVSGAGPVVERALSGVGLGLKDVSRVLLTHAHPDHHGGLAEIVRASGCKVLAHALAEAWIEDPALEERERPVPGFQAIMGEPVEVDESLEDCAWVETGCGFRLQAIHTPGHSPDHLSYFEPESGALFCGDAVPVPGAPPVYEDAAAVARSIRRLQGVKGVKTLYSAWDEPRIGDEAAAALDGGLSVVRSLDRAVREAMASLGASADLPTVAADALKRAGLPPLPPHPVLLAAVRSHMEISDAIV